jgi:uncharacterized protein (TIGR02598 family)
MFYKRAFSLVEVVVAVGIFALAIVGVIGLLSPTNKAVADVADSDAASCAISAIQAGLQQAGFEAVRTQLKIGSLVDSDYVFFASKAGDKVGLGSNKSVFPDDRDKFFEFALVRNASLSDVGDDSTAGFLAFTISLRWPAYLSNGVKFDAHDQKSVLVVPAAITR